jgi:hypothetical protein
MIMSTVYSNSDDGIICGKMCIESTLVFYTRVSLIVIKLRLRPNHLKSVIKCYVFRFILLVAPCLIF